MAELLPSTRGRLLLACAAAALGLTVATCGGNPSGPSGGPTPLPPTPTPVPSPTPTPGNGLPSGMVCDPTPPPILRMHLKVHSDDGGRIVLDSKPLVVNVDKYCERVGFGDWKFCDTRPEGDPQRTACDYLVAGKAEDTGRWGPTWYYGPGLCIGSPSACANHPPEQFMAIAKANGTFEACAAEDGWPIAVNRTRCGTLDLKY